MTLYACFTIDNPMNLRPRPGCDWATDQGASCMACGGNMPEWPAECGGCARKARAEGIARGEIVEHEPRKGRKAA